MPPHGRPMQNRAVREITMFALFPLVLRTKKACIAIFVSLVLRKNCAQIYRIAKERDVSNKQNDCGGWLKDAHRFSCMKCKNFGTSFARHALATRYNHMYCEA